MSPASKQLLQDWLVNTGLNIAAVAVAALILAPYVVPVLRRCRR